MRASSSNIIFNNLMSNNGIIVTCLKQYVLTVIGLKIIKNIRNNFVRKEN